MVDSVYLNNFIEQANTQAPGKEGFETAWNKDGIDSDFAAAFGKLDLQDLNNIFQDPNNIFQDFDPETVIISLIGIVTALSNPQGETDANENGIGLDDLATASGKVDLNKIFQDFDPETVIVSLIGTVIALISPQEETHVQTSDNQKNVTFAMAESATFATDGNENGIALGDFATAPGKVDLQDPNNIFQGFDPKTIGIISLIGIVMALQAKSSSDFWKNMWEQASETMQLQIELAPIIAEATKASAKALADATREDANKALWSAVVSGVMFAATMVLTYSSLYSSPSSSAVNASSNAVEAAEKAGVDSAEKAAEKVAEDSAEKAAEKAVADNAEKSAEEAEKVATNKDTSWQKYLQGLDRATNISRTLTGPLGDVATNIIAHAYDTRKAKHQEEQGVQDALAKISEQFVQFFAQYFNRTQDQVPQGQQMIDQAMNILKSISDNMLQGTFKMFS